MKQLYLLLCIGIWLVMMGGAGLVLFPRLKSFALSAMTVIAGLVLSFFFVEHFVGLGSIEWLMPIALLLAFVVIYLRRHEWVDAQEEALAFVLCFFWALAWRIMLPNLDGGTEKLMNLALLDSYRTGTTLPPNDMWLSGHALDMYYGLQHYASALMGRLLHLNPGYNYHFAFATVIGLVGMCSWGTMRQWALMRSDANQSFWLRVAIVVAVVAGGTGVAPLATIIFPDMDPTIRSWANVRFMGAYENQAGEFARQHIFTPQNKLDLPMETMGYFMHIGDLHAVLSGFLLATIICLIFAYQIQHNFKVPRLVSVWMGALVILPIPLNMWILPTVGLLMVYFCYQYRRQLQDQWLYIALGVVVTTLLLQPFFFYFLRNSLGVGLKFVAADQHSPMPQYLILMWPLYALAALALCVRDKTGLSRIFGVFCIFVLLFTEFFVFDDSRGGTPSRFNTVLKWWSWTYVLVLVGIGGRLVTVAEQKWARYGAAAVAILVGTHVYDLGRIAFTMPRDAWGQLSGDAWVPWWQKDALEYLKSAPKGKVLENIGHEAYVNQSGLALLAEQPSEIGWINHENLWRGNPELINRIAENVDSFYKGENPHALEWLLEENIRYVLVTDRKPMDEATQQKINAQIGSAYAWQEFLKQPLIGIWVRK